MATTFTDSAALLGADAATAKQLAALDAANVQRKSQSGVSSGSLLGGMHGQRPPSSVPPVPPLAPLPPGSAVYPAMPLDVQGQRQVILAPNMNSPQAYKNRQLAFLNQLSSFLTSRNMPLPPAITGLPSAYDPSMSRWKNLEAGSEIGTVKIAGRDVDLFRLWTSVVQFGGCVKITQSNLWGNVVAQFGLPERLPQPQSNGNTATASALAALYGDVLASFEEMYVKNITQQQQHRRAAALRQAGGQMPSQGMPGMTPQHATMPAMPGTPQSSVVAGQPNMGQYPSPITPQTPQQYRSASVGLMGQGSAMPSASVSPATHNGPPVDMSQLPHTQNGLTQMDHDSDAESKKRKSMEAEASGQRTRRKTEDSETPVASSSTDTAPTRKQPSRRKVEYVPVAREMETAGGRDVKRLHAELNRAHAPLRDINEWGSVSIDALIMSLRSRLAVEMSYALTTLTVVSVMHANTPNSGFTIHLCPELMEELLDVLQEMAFPESTENAEDATIPIVSHRELISFITENSSSLYEGLKPKSGVLDVSKGLSSRPADIIRVIANILRNFSAVDANQTYLSQHNEMLDLVLRLTKLAPSSSSNPSGPKAASPNLTLSDLVAIRKDALSLLCNLSGRIQLCTGSEPTESERHRARAIYEFVACYLIDPRETISPTQIVIHAGPPLNPNMRPPYQADIALEVFSRISQSDNNRQAFRLATTNHRMWTLFTALVHRLPIVDGDFQISFRESWLSYILKVIISIYSLAFLMPPEMKARVRKDRSLAFVKVMLRLIKKFTMNAPNEYRQMFHLCARRAIEAVKVVDDKGDSLSETSNVNGPSLSFGMGYGESTGKNVEEGTGLLGGYQDDVTWGIMHAELDDVMFMELESLVRVQCN